jgi:hypothetical protein
MTSWLSLWQRYLPSEAGNGPTETQTKLVVAETLNTSSTHQHTSGQTHQRYASKHKRIKAQTHQSIGVHRTNRRLK